jgi:hypothetical protein
VIVTGGNVRHVGESRNLNRRVSPDLRSIAELSLVVGTPRPHRPIGPARQHMTLSDCDVGNVAESWHHARLRGIDEPAMPELAVIVESPGPNFAIGATQLKNRHRHPPE